MSALDVEPEQIDPLPGEQYGFAPPRCVAMNDAEPEPMSRRFRVAIYVWAALVLAVWAASRLHLLDSWWS